MCSHRPTAGVAGALLFFFLNLNPHQGKTMRQHASEFDFIGLVLIAAGIVMLLLGFNESEASCMFSNFTEACAHSFVFQSGSSPQTIALLTAGFVCIFACGANEYFTKRSPIIPPRLFKVISAPHRAPCRGISCFAYIDPYHWYFTPHHVLPCFGLLFGRILPAAIFSNPRCLCN